MLSFSSYSAFRPYFLSRMIMSSLEPDVDTLHLSLSHNIKMFGVSIQRGYIMRVVRAIYNIYSIGINKWKCEIRIVSLPDGGCTGTTQNMYARYNWLLMHHAYS